MKQTRHTTENIIRILRESEAAGLPPDEVWRRRNISGQTYLPVEEQVWRHERKGSTKVEGAGEREH